MHPLIAAWIEADRTHDEVVARAADVLDAARAAADAVTPDRARLRPATPEDVSVGAILWHHHLEDRAGPCDSFSWMRVDRVTHPGDGSFASEGASYPFLDRMFVEVDDAP